MDFIDRSGNYREKPRDRKVYEKTAVYGAAKKDGHIYVVKPKTIERWELPGGNLKEGESLKQALKREIKTKTGYEIEIIKPDIIEPKTERFYAYDTDEYSMKKMHFYRIKLKEELKDEIDEEIKQAKWVPETSLKPTNSNATQLEVFDELRKS